MNKTSKINHIAIDKTGKLWYNDIMKNNNTSTKENKMIEKLDGLLESVVTTNGFTFTYTPSLKVLGVTSPTGGLEIFHQMDEQTANEKVGDILEKYRNRS